MRNLSFGVAGLLAVVTAGAAAAADLPPVYKAAPVVAPVYGWTGLYVNGGFGYGMWTADTTTINPVTGACVLCVTQTQGGRGWLGTVGGGFDWQFSDRIVAGVFGDVDFARIKGTIQDQTPFFVGTVTENFTWDAGARIGWLVTPAILSYFNGGWSQTHFTGANMVLAFAGQATGFATPAFSKGGWFLGSGVEAMFAPGWFWRSEYRYADYGTVNLADTNQAGVMANTITFHPIVQTIRSEVVYKFNWSGR